MAGLFACNCLDGFYRTNIFGKCFECEGNEFEGLDCSGDYLDLKPGYWWAWQNYTHKERYRNFTSNINNPAPAYDPGQGQDFIDYTYPMPKPTKCPRERSVVHDQLVTFVTSELRFCFVCLFPGNFLKICSSREGRIREEKSLYVTLQWKQNFWMTKTKKSLKKWIRPVSNFLDVI